MVGIVIVLLLAWWVATHLGASAAVLGIVAALVGAWSLAKWRRRS